jgi:flavorubredoxin
MRKYVVPRIAEGVYSVGARDTGRRMSDASVPLPAGTTYNSYLVLGRKKHALVDTVAHGFEGDLLARIDQPSDLDGLDFVVMNNAGPDHAGAIPAVMKAAPKALLVASHRGAQMAKAFFGVQDDRMLLVKEGDILDLGGITMSFMDAPMLPSPDTMFTYLREEGVLFSGDFFAAHTSYGICDEDVGDIVHLARRHFGQALMPFRAQGKKALDRLAGLNVNVMAPGHGPVYKNPKKALDAYKAWISGATEEKALIAYASMRSSTAAMAGALAEELLGNGIDVKLHNLAVAEVGELAADMVDCRAVVLGSPTYHGGLHPLAAGFMNMVTTLHPPARLAAFFGSHGWSGGASKAASEHFLRAGMDMAGSLEVHGPPQERDLLACANLARTIAGKMKADGQ